MECAIKVAFTRMTGSNKSESKQKTDPEKGNGMGTVQLRRGGTATQDLFGRRQPSIFEHEDVSFEFCCVPQVAQPIRPRSLIENF
ncbi:hypothetical protein CEXT_469461 [Caerostris extrusa]|uniref:Uncharacterized protein n=1 Tax=Caerostris extrusa TaxID=172846 RepID=A0AAV4PBE8_CAEEX|nr:hypothetical protein CEXT_469461 [Caerostris extrusa]